MSDRLELFGSALRVRFVRNNDRYAHCIDAIGDTGLLEPVLESIEGSPDDAWPPSPPLQDLHIEERPGGVQVALLVGRAGRSHWSLSIAMDPSLDTIEFDAACRTSEQPGALGSSYRIDGKTDSLSMSDCGHGVRVDPIDGIDLPMFDTMQRTISLPARMVFESGTKTWRWRYRIGLAKP